MMLIGAGRMTLVYSPIAKTLSGQADAGMGLR